MILLHASCVALDGLGVLIRGPSGAGKSDLALRLIDGGAELVADDYCEVTATSQGLNARAPAAIAGKLEVRGQGIIALPHRANAEIAVVIDLAPYKQIERLPEVTTCVIAGVTMRWIQIDPTTASACARVRLAAQMAQASQSALRASR